MDRGNELQSKKGPEQIVNRPGIQAYLAGRPDVVVAYLFGSVARNQANDLSDVDIAILLTPDLAAHEMVERQLQLMVGLAPFSSHEIQVVILNQVSPLLAYEVVRDGLLLYEQDERVRVAYEVGVMKRYFDVKPMLDFHSQALARRIREVGLGRRQRRSPGALEAAQRIYGRLTRTTSR
jgi:uncharacterized protein